jgi:hypothetical protein
VAGKNNEMKTMPGYVYVLASNELIEKATQAGSTPILGWQGREYWIPAFAGMTPVRMQPVGTIHGVA